VAAFIEAPKTRTNVPIVTADERLTSREAEPAQRAVARLANARKKLDAAAAASSSRSISTGRGTDIWPRRETVSRVRHRADPDCRGRNGRLVFLGAVRQAGRGA
jgi:hypothetical protein